MSSIMLNNSAVGALLAPELWCRMGNLVLLQPFPDLMFHLLVHIEIRFAGIPLFFDDVNVRQRLRPWTCCTPSTPLMEGH